MKIQRVQIDAPEAAGTADAETPQADPRDLILRGARTLRLVQSGPEDLVEVRGASGTLELRVRLTPEGPVLQMESVRISLTASESVEVAAPKVSVKAGESLDLQSGGGMRVTGEADVRVDASGEVHVKGTKIYLN